jgi:hypothetical protein
MQNPFTRLKAERNGLEAKVIVLQAAIQASLTHLGTGNCKPFEVEEAIFLLKEAVATTPADALKQTKQEVLKELASIAVPTGGSNQEMIAVAARTELSRTDAEENNRVRNVLVVRVLLLQERLRHLLDAQVIVDTQGQAEAAKCEHALKIPSSDTLKQMEEWRDKAAKWDALSSSEGVI